MLLKWYLKLTYSHENWWKCLFLFYFILQKYGSANGKPHGTSMYTLSMVTNHQLSRQLSSNLKQLSHINYGGKCRGGGYGGPYFFFKKGEFFKNPREGGGMVTCPALVLQLFLKNSPLPPSNSWIPPLTINCTNTFKAMSWLTNYFGQFPGAKLLY